jgi:hypothetical protein
LQLLLHYSRTLAMQQAGKTTSRDLSNLSALCQTPRVIFTGWPSPSASCMLPLPLSPAALQQLRHNLVPYNLALFGLVLFPKIYVSTFNCTVQYYTVPYRTVPHCTAAHRTCVHVPPACPSSCPAGPVCHWQQPAAPKARCSLVPHPSAAAPLHIQTGSQGTVHPIKDNDTPCDILGPVTYRVNSVRLGACFATTPRSSW